MRITINAIIWGLGWLEKYEVEIKIYLKIFYHTPDDVYWTYIVHFISAPVYGYIERTHHHTREYAKLKIAT